MEWLFSRVNSFNLVKNGILQILNVIIIGFNLTVMFFYDAFAPWLMHTLNILTIVLATSLVIVGYMALNRYAKKINELETLSQQAANGELHHRITNIDSTEEVGRLAWAMNNMLDQIEIFSRDMNASLTMMSKKITYRKMEPKGLNGAFVHYANNINEALQTIAIAQGKDDFIKQILTTIEEYCEGDYRKKISTSGVQGDLVILAQGINDLGNELCKLSKMNLKNGLALQQNATLLENKVTILTNQSSSQASSLEQSAAALEEITSNIKNSNEKTLHMSEYATKIITASTNGENLAKQTNQAMDEINNQITSINEAITVIDQIAFQTNILSLNAAVEAATAGEAGKGFAVVAGEVRNLASRSAEAAREIKALVESATHKANDGKTIAYEMIKGYMELNKNIQTTSSLINDVTASSKEQEIGINQIYEAVNSLEKTTQESVKIANETNIIAKQTHQISGVIVEDANRSMFDEKNSIRTRKKIIDPDFKGVERRKIEQAIKSNALKYA